MKIADTVENRKTVNDERFPIFWYIPQGGFHWEEPDGLKGAGRRLVTNGTVSERSYQPMVEEPLLYRKLARIAPTESGVQDFANKFGCLGFHLPHVGSHSIGNSNVAFGDPLPDIDWGSMDLAVTWNEAGEFLGEWKRVIGVVKDLLGLWDSIRLPGSTASETLSSADTDAGSADSGIPEPYSAFWYQMYWDLLYRLNTQLAKHVAPGLLSIGDADRPRLYTVPKNLAGVVLLQLARAIDGNREIRKCMVCGKEFEISRHIGNERYTEEIHRSHTQYCGRNCRQRAYRLRRRAIVELCDRGKTTEEIINETGFRDDTVEACVEEWTSKGGKVRRKRGRPHKEQ
jgi:hypothetical protein